MELIAKLRYMGRQYANGQAARGGGQQKHYLEEAADEIEALRAKVIGVGRDAENDKALVVYFDKPPSDGGLRGLDEMLRAKDELDRCIGEIRGLREAANALLHQIDIGDFVDSHGHSAKMLKATHDLMALMVPNEKFQGRP